MVVEDLARRVVRPSQWVVLYSLSRTEPKSAQDVQNNIQRLAFLERVNIPPLNVESALEKLVSLGLIVRVPKIASSDVQCYRLTQIGEMVALFGRASARASLEDRLMRFLSGLCPEFPIIP